MTAPPESGTSPDDPVPEVTVRVSGLSKRFDEVEALQRYRLLTGR